MPSVHGKPRKLEREKPVKASLSIEIVAPLVMRSPMPRSAYMVASVMMNGGRPICTTPKAWKRPMKTPMASEMVTAPGDRRGEAEVIGEQPRHRHRDEAGDRADRKVDAAGDDDECLADRQDRDHRALAQEIGHVVRGPEGRGLDREREPHDQQQAEQREAEQHVETPAAPAILRDGLISHVP